MEYSKLTVARSLAGFAAPFVFFGALVVSGWLGLPKTTEVKAAESSKSKVVSMTVTGYSVDRRQCGKINGITASGTDGRKVHGVAADNKLLPMGTRIYIPGVGERVVDDTGGDMRKAARHGKYHIDLRFLASNDKEAFKKAKRWGRKKLEVTILDAPAKS